MQVNPYLVFDGQCEAAFKHYERVLGGRINSLMRFSDGPGCEDMPAAARDQVMHVCMSVGEQVLMASDCPPGQYEPPAGTSVTINIDDRDEGERIFNALAEGGTVRMPFDETFWASGFGMCVDRFGTPWMVSAGGKDPTR